MCLGCSNGSFEYLQHIIRKIIFSKALLSTGLIIVFIQPVVEHQSNWQVCIGGILDVVS